ncbi:helix-turn-helix domain-containing protein [Longimicrobium sp.]|uniref:helix-turn-helix domain-containing protein n=1 Tax=Longimicrobium sp. TaxID=2029185 RepID=UPI002E32E490|nr:helix-turn-helix domain-containing protein [Longimicrobium sp.]HEX6041229.1 helix-turn-helix domain-containing protein [Longimicrobium sp.]
MTTDAERMYLHTGDEALFWTTGDAPGGAFASVAPAAPLRGFVERIGIGREWVDPAHPLTERVLPDGGVHLVFNLGDAPAVPGTTPTACEALGARCAPSIIRMAGRVEQVTVTLRPGGMAALLGIPAAELSAADAPLDALWGPRAAEALERMADVPVGPARVAAMETVLAERLAAVAARPDAVAAEAVRRIEASRGRIRVRALAEGLGVSERRLEQVFHRHVGLSPKSVCRIARFRATVALLRRDPQRPWSDVAYSCGFYDQSHLVNEFQALAGLAPGDFRGRSCGFFQDASPAAD